MHNYPLAKKHGEYSSSRVDGTKRFQLEGNLFGWEAVVGMYEQECEEKQGKCQDDSKIA